ncbi:hypothetical protein FIBSPDRAFT_937929 [Athelia psychrophila]|uniref:DUF6533 domain-containing protein n=1 Tax=Athelia psychrophila TaxID=1759441 RepID=A0A165ZLH8_9AGAM|nr:hypothetical protein FIBSPDRAFT_937929 [Fibularhizoctonia sp. CBS 109695]
MSDAATFEPSSAVSLQALERDAQTAKYIVISAMTCLTWDWMLSVVEEYRMVKKCGLSIAVAVYFLARISMTVNFVLIIIFQSSLLGCTSLFIAMIATMTGIGAAADSYIFFLRVRAVCNNSRTVTLIFGAGCLTVAATNIALPFSIHASRLMDAHRCYYSSTEAWSTVNLWVRAAYNSAVFITISARIASYGIRHQPSQHKRRVQAFFSAEELPCIFRNLLHGGQFFYFSTIGLTLVAAVMAVLPLSSIWRAILSNPSLASETIMTCRIFRVFVLGAETDGHMSIHSATTRFSTVDILSKIEDRQEATVR